MERSARRQLRARAAFARALRSVDPRRSTTSSLLDALDDWLPPLLAGKRRLRDIDPGALAVQRSSLLGWKRAQGVDRLAPADFASPAGSRHPIDYPRQAGPTVEVRAQALFGLPQHPTIAGGKVPLVLAITSPAGRPIQTTRDLPGFWAGSWRDVAKEMRGRYPEASVARRPRRRRADAEDQARIARP